MPKKNTLAQFYPAISPFDQGLLKVDKIHEIYWEQSGNPEGLPVIFFHGGPGSGTNPSQRRYFDPSFYRIILFDQRGCGKSLPYGEINENTLWHLIDDIEKLRKFLNINQWVIFGGSWGVTLAIAYGKEHPERCIAFILRGIFLGRPEELDWFLNGLQNFFPEAHKKLHDFLPVEEHSELLFHFYRRLKSQDENINLPAARAWNDYETSCSVLLPQQTNFLSNPSLALARIEVHYFINNMFLDEKPILNNLKTISQKPATLIQGRYDMICPTKSAIELAENWPNSDLKIISDAGHSASEQGIRSALIETMNTLRGDL